MACPAVQPACYSGKERSLVSLPVMHLYLDLEHVDSLSGSLIVGLHTVNRKEILELTGIAEGRRIES